MESLIIPATDNSPKVSFNINEVEKGKYIFLILGESRPEDVKKFYDQIIDWLERFEQHLCVLETIGKDTRKRKIRLKFKMDYFNSSSAKFLLDVIWKLEEIKRKTTIADIKIIWIYDDGDEDMYESGMELKNMTRLPFNLSKLRSGEKFTEEAEHESENL